MGPESARGSMSGGGPALGGAAGQCDAGLGTSVGYGECVGVIIGATGDDAQDVGGSHDGSRSPVFASWGGGQGSTGESSREVLFPNLGAALGAAATTCGRVGNSPAQFSPWETVLWGRE